MTALLNEIDVAEMLGVSRRQLRTMVNRGDFAGVAIVLSPKTVRFDREKLDEWLEQRRSAVKS